MSTETFKQYLDKQADNEQLSWSERVAYKDCAEQWAGSDDHREIDTIDDLKDEISYLQGQVANFEWALECADFTDNQIDLIRMGYFDKVNFDNPNYIINDEALFEDTADGIANQIDTPFTAEDLDDWAKEEVLEVMYQAQTDWIQEYSHNLLKDK